MDSGTDVNFGALTRMLFEHLNNKDINIQYEHQVDDLKRTKDGLWELKIRNLGSGELRITMRNLCLSEAEEGVCHFTKVRYS